MINTVIVEDEELARDLVLSYLSKHSDINIVAECADGFSGAKAINQHKPDLLILDIQMPKLTGFELLELIEHNPVIVFTTAYDQFAIKAFEQNATDYLLKPFSQARMDAALEKVRDKLKSKPKESHSALINTIDENAEQLERIAVKSGQKIHVVSTEDIIYLEAEGDYVMIHSNDGKFLKEKTMKYFEQHLPSDEFVRIHRSHIVNINAIDKIELWEKQSYMVILKNKQQLRASANGYKLLKGKLQL